MVHFSMIRFDGASGACQVFFVIILAAMVRFAKFDGDGSLHSEAARLVSQNG